MLGSQGQAVNAKKYHRDSIIFRGQAAFCSFSRAQSATDEALVDAFCFSGATLPNPNATTRIVRQQLNRWVVNISALHVGPRKIFWRDFNQRGVTVLYVAWCAAAVKVQPPGAVSAACPWGGVTKGQTIRHDKLSVVR